MRTSPRHRLVAALLSLLVVAAGLGVAAGAAQAAYVMNLTSAQPTGTTDAMAYSDFAINLAFPSDSTPKSLDIDLPKGQLGVLSSAAVCPQASFTADACPGTSAIGSSTTIADAGIAGTLTSPGTVYRIPATGTEVGRLGIVVRPPIGDKLFIEGTMRVRDDGTYGIRASVPTLPKQANLTVPILGKIPIDIDIQQLQMVLYAHVGGGSTGPGFAFNPAECTTATTKVASTAYDNQTATATATYTPTNCAAAPFAPSVSFTPNPSPASSPAPFTVTVSNPFDPAAAKVPEPLRTTKLILPAGVQLTGATNSDGQLVACSDAQFGYGNLAPATCPAGSKVGSVTMDSPLVGQIPGDVFLAQPQAGPNDLIRLFIVAQAGTQSDALRVKLRVRVEVDPVTGTMTNTLEDLPAQPVKAFVFSFRAGSAPGTRQPRTCGTYPGSADLTSYASPTVVRRSANYVVGLNCPAAGSFHPMLAMTTSPTQAGAATTGTTTIDLPVGDEPVTHLKVSLPPGMLANVDGVQRCTFAQARADACPAASQVGTVLSLAGQSTAPGSFTGQVFLTDPPDDRSLVGLFVRVPVLVGPIDVSTIRLQAAIALRPDYGIDVVADVPQTIRGLQLDQQRLRLTFDRANFLTNPPRCDGNTVSGQFTSSAGTQASASQPLTVTGCDALAFAPSVAFTASPASATAASALTTTVSLPASTPGHAQASPKRIAVTLPEGVTLSPSAGATGDLTGCTDEQFHLADLAAPSCPAGSGVGTVSIQTPSVGRLSGSAYLAATAPGHLTRLLIDATSDALGPGARVKLAGTIDVDAATGRTTAVFDDLPPVAFTQFSLTMRGGAAPVLAMPRACGTTTGSAELTPQAGAAVTVSAGLTIDADCPGPAAFAPQLAVQTGTTQAAADTSLTTTITVPAGSDDLTGLDLTMPRGLLGRLTAVPLCPLDRAQAGTCDDASLVGTVTASTGVRSAPYAVNGRVYMTAGRDDAIAGLSFVLPAKVGPIDLGDVITQSWLRIAGKDLQLRITADAIPAAVHGIPLHVGSLAIAITKPGVVLNASSCEGRAASATFTAAGGATASATAFYQASGCDRLGWAPSMALDFTGPSGDLKAKGHPSVTTVIGQTEGQGNLRTADVVLPDGVSTDLTNINSRLCGSPEIASAGGCPATSQVGSAEIVTSALPRPIEAPIYLVKVVGQTLPGLALRVRDQLSFDLVGTTKITGSGQIRVLFDGTPDTPISRMSLTFAGGTGGVLVLSRDICAAGRTDATLTAQHGAVRTFDLPVMCNGKASSSFNGSGTVGGTATLTVRPAGRHRGYTLVAKSATGLRRLTFTMPKGFSYAKGARSRLTVKVTGAATRKPRVTRTVKGRTLTVRIASAKVTAVTVTAPAKATRFTAAYAQKLRSKAAQKALKPSLSIVGDTAKTLTPTQTVKVSLSKR